MTQIRNANDLAVAKYWNTHNYNFCRFIGSLARGVDIISKNIQDELKIKVKSDIIAKLQKASEELIFTTLTVQEKMEICKAKSNHYSNINPSTEQDTEFIIAMMKGWQTEYTQEEMHESLELFKKGIDEDSPDRKLFF